jgi:hypothetical protein
MAQSHFKSQGKRGAVSFDGIGVKANAKTKSRKSLSDLLMGFAVELSKVRVLDPACGSGNCV